MKAKVLKKFRDLKEDLIRNPGDEFTLTKDRFEEINKKLPGFLEEIKEETDKETEKETNKENKKEEIKETKKSKNKKGDK